MTDIQKLKALAEAATQGPWGSEGNNLYWYEDGYTKHLMETDDGSDICHDEEHPANLKFIAAANPAAVLELIAELEKFDEGMRSLACSLSAGGYNAVTLTADQLVEKVDAGLEMFTTATGGLLDKVTSECDQLRAESAGLKTGYEAYEQVNAELRGEVEALRKDAERYRWLCENACDLNFYAAGQNNDQPGDCRPIMGRVEIDPDQYPVKTWGSAKVELDAAIDAAMSKEAQS